MIGFVFVGNWVICLQKLVFSLNISNKVYDSNLLGKKSFLGIGNCENVDFEASPKKGQTSVGSV